MRRRWTISALVLSAWSSGRAAGPSLLHAQAARPVSSARAAELQAALDQWAAQPAHQGVSASVIFADGGQWTGVAGREGDSTHLRPEHLIWIASITKTMTGAVILQLADEGRLSLDDPLSRWLAPRPNVDPAITVRQLLNHTSGVANYTGTEALRSALAAGSSRAFTADELLAFVGPPLFERGARTLYTNTAFVLLAQIAERVTGRPIERLFVERLWRPLGLTEVFLAAHQPAPGPVALARGDAGVVQPLSNVALLSIGHGAFGVMASARTVARWGRALFAGGVVSPAMQVAMRVLVPAAGNIPGESGAGLGIRSYNYLGRLQYGHSGGSTYGSSLMLFDPVSGVTVAVLMNQGQGAGHFVLAPRLLEIAAGR